MANHDPSGLLPQHSRKSRNVALICAFAAWMTAAGGALAALTDYASRPGTAALAPTSWPRASHLARTPGRATLVMVAHTKCSCTRASLHELERAMANAGSRIEAIVVFVGPRETRGLDGLRDLRSTARAIPNVRVVEDESEARLFGAATSGQVLLYEESGALVFRGGLTAARGHEGDSVGGDVVRGFSVTHASPATTITASEVFGCALFDTHTQDSGAPATGARKDP